MRISLLEACPELVEEWSERNLPLTPTDVTRGSNKKVWWRGACGHEWNGIVKNRANGHGCPYCSGNAVLPGLNDLASCYPEVAAEWSERNLPLTPEQVTKRSTRKVWWVCKQTGHEWYARIADRAVGHGCPYCNDGKLLQGFNDLEHCFPEIAEEWSERNFPRKPSQIKPKSRENVWWRCSVCDFEWQAVVYARVLGRKCPSCAQMERDRLNAWKYDKPFLTRLPLEVFSYYAEEIGQEVLRYDDSVVGIPLSVYLPEVKSALEMSRAKIHFTEERVKNELCWRARIRLIRIVEPNAVVYDNCKCIKKCDTSITSLNLALDAAFELMGLKAPIDAERDMLKVYDRYRLNQSKATT